MQTKNRFYQRYFLQQKHLKHRCGIILGQRGIGKTTTFKQIKDLRYGYLAVDDLEQGIGQKIPLWLFGFLY